MGFNRFNEALLFFKSLTLQKICNIIKLRFSYLVSVLFNIQVHWGKPESISIEPTNLCNLKCPECPSGNNQMTRARIFLSEDKYANYIRQFSPWLINLQLFFQGEPFIHPKIYDFIKLATDKGIYTSTSTNGHFLSANNCQKIINSGLKRLIISVDGANQKTYEKYRVGGSLDMVIAGIKQLVDAKKNSNSNHPTVIIQFIVFKNNEHEIPAIKQLAKKLSVDYLQFKTAQIDNFKHGNPLIPKTQKYSRYKADNKGIYHIKRNNNFKCKRIWFGSVISAQGQLLPCCFDKNGDHAFNEKNKLEITDWKNKKALLFRKQVWNNSNQFEMCRNCSEGLKL